MKRLSIILACILVAMISCTKSKEVHPEIGDGNDELVTVGMKDVHVKYIPADISEFSKVVFRYCPANANGSAQQFAAAEMTKNETLFELTLNDLLKDTLYWYYYELYPNGGDAFNTPQKTFHTQVIDAPEPPVAELPTVTTAEVSEITANSARCGGDVINDGGATVTEFGICWSTNANPTLDDSHVAVGAGIGHFFASMTNLEANTTYHVRAYATNVAGAAYGQDIEFTTLQGGGSGEHEYVDLGLPSGTLWATCNVGANAPEEYGDYFAWGETTPKTTYNWSTYKYCNGDINQLTKYCNDASSGYNGFTDDLTSLLPEDDAATVNWGNGWRMPTDAEWTELYQNTTCTWTTQNGVNGRRFTASNGNSLFLPAAGDQWNDEPHYAGSKGYYWSSSLYTDWPNSAWYFYIDSGYYGVGYHGDRRYGDTVRPVRSAP
ncbi:MAG: hypothetical protein II887_01965 [Bacteroidales bacterium]|nr:hypothetical protein [Bacteroidales bacterium]